VFTIENIEKRPSNIIEFEQVIQAIATIEAMVQLQEAWTYQTLIELLKQDSINMLSVYEQQQGINNKVLGIVYIKWFLNKQRFYALVPILTINAKALLRNFLLDCIKSYSIIRWKIYC